MTLVLCRIEPIDVNTRIFSFPHSSERNKITRLGSRVGFEERTSGRIQTER